MWSSALIIAALVPLLALATPVQIPLALSSHSNVVSSSDASYTSAATPETHETYGSLVAALAAPGLAVWPLDVDSTAKMMQMQDTGEVEEGQANSGEEEGFMRGVCPDLTVRCVLDGNWAKPVGYIGRKRMSFTIPFLYPTPTREARSAPSSIHPCLVDQEEGREAAKGVWVKVPLLAPLI